MTNIRVKGASGEREICDALNNIYRELYEELNLEYPEKPLAQRNSNQSAVGGDDISNTCNYSIEVKRHETPKVNQWWEQTCASAAETGKMPCLLYRANRQKWRCVMLVNPIRWYASEDLFKVRAEMSFDDFLMFFKNHARQYIIENGSPR